LENVMKRASWQLGSSAVTVTVCALGLACTGTIDKPGGQSGPEGTGATGATGAAGAAAAAGAGGSAGATSSGGTTAQGGSVSAGSGGSAGAGATGGTTTVLPPFQPAPGTLRRLTRAQFRSAIRDLLGETVDVTELEADSFNSGDFAVTGASVVSTSRTGVDQYQSVIEEAVSAVFADETKRQALIGCVPAGAAGDACTRGFFERFGRRAWRRPLDVVEVDRLVGLAENGATELGSVTEGVRWATVAVLASPNFIYRAELGAPALDGALRFTGYEMASRLAFLIWNSVPDDALLDEAAAGGLQTPESVRAAAERLLSSPAGREAVGNFAEEYMRLDRVLLQAKDPELYPEYTGTLQAAMVRDMRSAWESVAFDAQTSVLDVFTTGTTAVNSELATLYGLDSTGLDPNTFRTATLPADGPRLGILGKSGFLSQFANQKYGSPTLRGKFLSEAFLCTPIQPPPGDVNTDIPEPPDDMPMTRRQQLSMHSTNPTCAGCHMMMDPMGFPFENFDAVGRYRTMDHGLPVDASGEFPMSDGSLLPVADAKAFAVAASTSELVARCMARKYYSYAMGYKERDVDAAAVEALYESFRASGFKLRDLILNLATHDAFALVAAQP
jgi:hypothetical protein